MVVTIRDDIVEVVVGGEIGEVVTEDIVTEDIVEVVAADSYSSSSDTIP